MPHKVGFIVVSSSGHEDGFSAKELMVHAPTINGWRSPRLCQYPQEIVLQMVERCRIRKLQLLAHQYMISSKIEFYISDNLPEYFAPYKSERFRRLGYVSLSDNEKTGYKARELKSVYVDAVGQYLKLTFHKNYVNRYNLYSQVALVAINIIGEPADFSSDNSHASREKLIDHYLGNNPDESALDGTYIGKPDSISPLDDLAFDMYQDPEVAQIIRKLDEKKHEAVRKEHYDQAKKLKQAIADLQKVGERLGRYEVEKRCAVEREDYDLAKQKKQQMEEYRLKVYQQLELHNLLDPDLMVRRPPDLPLDPLAYPATSPHQKKPLLSPRRDRTEAEAAEALSPEKPPEALSPEPVLAQSPSPPAAQAAPLSTESGNPKINADFIPYDERPLPATRKQQQEEGFAYLDPEMNEEDMGDTPRSGTVGEPEPLTEKALREASTAIEVFGEGLVAGAYSKTWSYREDSLLAIYKKMMEVSPSTPKEDLKNLLRGAIFLIVRAIKDIVSSVFHASLKLLKMIITQYIPAHKLGKQETAHCVERTFPNLLSRTGDSSARLRIAAANFIQEMALCNEVRPLQIIPAHLVHPLKPNSPTHLAMSQVELVERLLKDLGTDNTGFTIDNVMRFATGGLEHRVYEVRETALRVILDMYRQHRAIILDYLPPDDANTRKNVLYKTLFDGFAKIDGKPTESEMRAQKKAASEEAERQKKDEIKVLQGQLAALKEMQTEAQAAKEKEADFQKSKNPGDILKAPQPTDVADDHSSVTNYLDNLCIFCGERDESFTEEGLDLHYWKRCLMLTRCDFCKQVVEIASLTEHLLTECDKRDNFGKCPRCCEALPKDELPRHIKGKACNPAKPEKVANRCPLCHENFTPGEEAWKVHLMGKDGCRMNLRRTQILNKSLPSQSVTGRTAAPLNRSGPPAVKLRSPSVGSKIPTPRGGLNKSTGRTYAKR
ncbi:centrosomal protein of 104 kDa [Sceloporus undulatus]|uniref:centrosomal protein of 104 kDa n=1 Tax=Sceloporus undulatus TaxID=8520 RepID=UPI001C4D64D1|nr:centrosomal protein of 104 kDa [Sceloporus undulatus]XP_042336408.1 centrosomal protein of 104 kDa [Sceloporus undulatus]XP_042336409.1 centrosomal protein of 104 kDa [Sceloporus undulatus]